MILRILDYKLERVGIAKGYKKGIEREEERERRRKEREREREREEGVRKRE